MSTSRNFQTQASPPPAHRPQGKKYLMAIGIDAYPHVQKLKNCQQDAHAFVQMMINHYGFSPDQVVELYNEAAKKEAILAQLEALSHQLQKGDDLIIYFAGHGYYDSRSKIGFLVPYDGRQGANYSLIFNSVILDYIKGLEAHHMFLIVDSCYSGSLIRAQRAMDLGGTRAKIEARAMRLDKRPSRWGLSAGSIEKVADGLSGRHSPFAQALLGYLAEPDAAVFAVSELIHHVQNVVSYNSDQEPLAGVLLKTGDQTGQFVFRKESLNKEQRLLQQNDAAAWAKAEAKETTEGYKAYLAAFPQGDYAKIARSRLERLERKQKKSLEESKRKERLATFLNEARLLVQEGEKERAQEFFEEGLEIALDREKASIKEEMAQYFRASAKPKSPQTLFRRARHGNDTG